MRFSIQIAAATLVAVSAVGAANAEGTTTHRIMRADGSDIVYHLGNVGEGSQGALIMLQGSGCNPVSENEHIPRDGPILRPSSVIITIDKYGVDPGSDEEAVEGCTPSFWSRGTVQQRVLDGTRVVSALRDEPWWNGDLVIFGGSEGGAVAAMLAPLLPETDAVIVFSSGIGVNVHDMLRSVLPPEAQEQAEAAFAEAREYPTGSRRFGGASYRWWADSLDLLAARALLGSDFPILLVHGERDQFSPVDTARASIALWSANDRPDVTYREYPGYDHFMEDEAGENHSDAVMADIASWLASTDALGGRE